MENSMESEELLKRALNLGYSMGMRGFDLDANPYLSVEPRLAEKWSQGVHMAEMGLNKIKGLGLQRPKKVANL